jgi:F-box associated region
MSSVVCIIIFFIVDKLKNWSIICEGGNRFATECPPLGCDNLPDEVTNSFQNSCFVTSYYICSKEQTIDLNVIGIPERVMNCYKPSILISEWYAARTDCGSVYESEISLMDSKYTILAKYPFRATFAQWEGGAWHKVCSIFQLSFRI